MKTAFALILFAAWTIPLTGWSQGYAYTNIADNSAGSFFTQVGGSPGLNDAGTVVFYGQYGSNSNQSGIYLSTEGNITTVISSDSQSAYQSFFGNPSINNAGSVGIIAKSVSATVQMPLTLSSSGEVQHESVVYYTTLPANTATKINSSGAFMIAGSPSSSSSPDILTSQGISVVADTLGQYQGYAANPTINDSGQVVFIGQTSQGNGIYSRETTYYDSSTGFVPNGPITPVITPDSTFSSFNRAIVNNEGTVAFGANLAAGGVGVFTIKDGDVSTLALSTDGLFSSFIAITLNDQDAVAFVGRLAGGGSGIYLSLDGQLTRVIGTGDALFGSTVQSLGLGQDGLNNNDEIAFSYTLANGVAGYSVASSVPEPATCALIGLGIVGLLVRRRGFHFSRAARR